MVKKYLSRYQQLRVFNVIVYTVIMAIVFAWGAFLVSLIEAAFNK